jgi:AcrR family transcriptional regulator
MKEKGYANTTMDDIAAQMGVSKGAIYQYFKTRDELLAVLIQTMQEKNLKVGKKAVTNQSPMEAWTTILEQYLLLDDQYNALFFEILAVSSHNDAVKNIFSTEIIHKLDHVAKGLEKQQKNGLIHLRSDPETIAVAITALFLGLRGLVLIGKDKDEIRERWRSIGSIILGLEE